MARIPSVASGMPSASAKHFSSPSRLASWRTSRLRLTRGRQVGAILALTATDAELAQRCLEGDQHAWAEIVRQYSRRIYNLAYRFTSSHSAAEDLTQEVFIRVYRSLTQYDAALGDLSNWLMRLARNLVIDDYRKRQRTRTEPGDELDNQVH